MGDVVKGGSGQGRAALAMLAFAMLTGCASDTRLREAELDELAAWLPGSYDNTEQAGADAAAGRTQHEALAIVIAPIYAAPLGKHAFYVQEMAADDPRRVMRQRVFAFDIDGDDRIVQGIYSLAEPLRWRDAHLNPDLFKGLIPHEDLRPATGCELVWKREDARFVGANDPARCRVSSRAAGGSVRLESRAELTPDELAIGESSYDANGRLVYGHAEEPLYRFSKRAD
jgi:hypothetical protein